MIKKAVVLIIIFSGCKAQAFIDTPLYIAQEGIKSNKGEKWSQRNGFKLELSKLKIQNHTGWWIYGEGQHIFKDEVSLEEWNLEFPNENMEELKNLYLAVCEMEYFPMESKMIGYFKNNDVLEGKTFIVTDFEILYIQGCGD